MRIAQNITLVAFMLACVLAILGWPAALVWYALIAVASWGLAAVGIACMTLIGSVAK